MASPASPSTPPGTTPRAHEPLFGSILFAGMALFVILAVAGVAYAAFVAWQSHHKSAAEPSISLLNDEPVVPSQASQTDIKIEPEPQAAVAVPATQSDNSAKSTAVSVQNGGAAKGSAGVLQEALKTAGFTKVSAGNTLKDYTGTTVYYASGLDKEAEAVKIEVAKKYPTAITKPADPANKETSVAVITVILGK